MDHTRRTFLKAGIIAAGTGVSGLALPGAQGERTGHPISASFEVLGLQGTASVELPPLAPARPQLAVTVRKLTSATAFVRIQGPAGQPLEIKRFSVRLSVPNKDVYRIWYGQQLGHFGHDVYVSPPWNTEMDATGHHGLFLGGFQDQFGRNTAYAGLRDQDGDGSLGFAMEYGGSQCHLTFAKFIRDGTFKVPELDEGVYVSVENLPEIDVVRSFVAWYDREWNLSYDTPASSFEPAFNTWYAIKGDQNAEATLHYAASCAKLGFKTFEIDAGWFTNNAEWKANPTRFPDLADTVRRVQQMGLKIIVWYNPFEVGHGSSLAGLRTKVDGKLTSKMCPRNPPSRQRAAEMARQVMRDYGLDGLKVDFLDLGGLPLDRCEADHEHDCDFVSVGVRRGMGLIAEAIRGVRRDAIIEYRLNYANVANRQFCTIYRGQDAPSEPELVRRHMALLRFWNAGVAVHADYAYWTPDESPEYVSRFLAGMCFYGVPTISNKLDQLPQPHLDIIQAWLGYYHAHKADFIPGQFDPLSYDAHYSVARVSGNSHSYLAAFTSAWPSFIPLLPEHAETITLYNGTSRPQLTTVLSGVEGAYTLSVTDIALKPTGGLGKVHAKHNLLELVELPVPVGGLLTLTKV